MTGGSEVEISPDLDTCNKIRTDEGPTNPVLLGQVIRNTNSANVPSVIREIEIWREAVLMVNRYADEAEANSFQRAEELRPKGESRRSAPKLAAGGRSRWGGYLASDHCHDRATYRHNGAAKLINSRIQSSADPYECGGTLKWTTFVRQPEPCLKV